MGFKKYGKQYGEAVIAGLFVYGANMTVQWITRKIERKFGKKNRRRSKKV